MPPHRESGLEVIRHLKPSRWKEKTSGPVHIPGRLLKELSNKIALVFHIIFVQSINDGIFSSDWSLAYVTPVSNKGNKNWAENYDQFH